MSWRLLGVILLLALAPSIATTPVRGDDAPPLPGMPAEAAARLEAISDRVAELRLTMEDDALREALRLVEESLVIRREHQGGWTAPGGAPAEWWQIGEARRMHAHLSRLLALSPDDRAALVEAERRNEPLFAAFGRGDYAEALKVCEAQHHAWQRLLGDDDENTLMVCNNIGLLLDIQGKTAEAETWYRRALDGRRAGVLGDEHPDTLDSLSGMASLHEARGELADAEPLYRAVVDGMRRLRGDDDVETVNALDQLGVLLHSRGKLSEAEPLAHETLDGFRSLLGDDDHHTLSALNNLGTVLDSQGKLAEAERCYRASLEGSRRVQGDDHLNTIVSISNLGYILMAQGKLADAEPLMREAVERAQRALGDDHPSTLSFITNLGTLLHNMGRLAEAEVFHREALDRKRSVHGDDHPDTLVSIGNVGGLLRGQGRTAEAEPYYREALAGRRRTLGDDHPNTLTSINNMGSLLHTQGKLEEAEALYRQALDDTRAKLGDEHPDTLTSVNNLATVLEAQGRAGEAEVLYRAALAGRRHTLGDDHPDTLTSVFNLGSRLEAHGALADAERLFREALNGWRRVLGSNHPDTMSALDRLGTLREKQGDLDDAERCAREALDIAERRRGEATGGESGRAAMAGSLGLRKIASRLATLLVRRGGAAEAWTIAERGRSRALLDLLARSETDLAEMVDDPARLDAARAREHDARIAETAAEARLGALRTERELIASSDDLAGDARAERLAAFDVEIEAQHERVLRARRDAAEATSNVFLELSGVLPDAHPMTDDAIRSALAPGEAVLGFIWTSDAVVAMTADGDRGMSAFIVADGADAVRTLHDEVTAIRTAMSSRPRDAWSRAASAAAARLEARLVPEPVRAALAGATRVVLLPDGPLTGLPLEALSLGAAGSALDDERIQIVHASSATVYLNRRDAGRAAAARRAAGSIVALGDPRFHRTADEGTVMLVDASRGMEEALAEASMLDLVRLHGGELPRLPGSRAEVERLADVGGAAGVAATTLLDTDATIANLESSVRGARYLHIATHGLTGSAARPFDASLALAVPLTPTPDDIGFLTLDHLIRTWRGKLDGCDLVVLSACDTQRGVQRGDSMMALPWGFFFAGAPTVVASLWQIDDEATALLMGRFYENLLGTRGEPMAKADALQEAKRWLRTYEVEDRGAIRLPGRAVERRRPYEHPYYWAAFVLIGDPG